jgi:hypothetical protein
VIALCGMARNHRRLVRKRSKQADHIANELWLGERRNLKRMRRPAEAPHIGRHDVISRFAQRLQLVAPGIPAFRKSAAEDETRTVGRSGLDKMEPYAIRRHRTMPDIDHIFLLRITYFRPSLLSYGAASRAARRTHDLRA